MRSSVTCEKVWGLDTGFTKKCPSLQSCFHWCKLFSFLVCGRCQAKLLTWSQPVQIHAAFQAHTDMHSRDYNQKQNTSNCSRTDSPLSPNFVQIIGLLGGGGAGKKRDSVGHILRNTWFFHKITSVNVSYHSLLETKLWLILHLLISHRQNTSQIKDDKHWNWKRGHKLMFMTSPNRHILPGSPRRKQHMLHKQVRKVEELLPQRPSMSYSQTSVCRYSAREEWACKQTRVNKAQSCLLLKYDCPGNL